jgi:hypothetical protein
MEKHGGSNETMPFQSFFMLMSVRMATRLTQLQPWWRCQPIRKGIPDEALFFVVLFRGDPGRHALTDPAGGT